MRFCEFMPERTVVGREFCFSLKKRWLLLVCMMKTEYQCVLINVFCLPIDPLYTTLSIFAPVCLFVCVLDLFWFGAIHSSRLFACLLTIYASFLFISFQFIIIYLQAQSFYIIVYWNNEAMSVAHAIFPSSFLASIFSIVFFYFLFWISASLSICLHVALFIFVRAWASVCARVRVL